MSLVLKGFATIVLLTSLCFGAALVMGLVVVVLRIAPVPVLRGVGTVYVEVWRNVPLLAWLVLFVFGLPSYGLDLPLFWKLVVPLAFSHAAAFGVIFRASDCRAAAGVRHMAPSLVTQSIGLLKNTALGS